MEDRPYYHLMDWERDPDDDDGKRSVAVCPHSWIIPKARHCYWPRNATSSLIKKSGPPKLKWLICTASKILKSSDSKEKILRYEAKYILTSDLDTTDTDKTKRSRFEGDSGSSDEESSRSPARSPPPPVQPQTTKPTVKKIKCASRSQVPTVHFKRSCSSFASLWPQASTLYILSTGYSLANIPRQLLDAVSASVYSTCRGAGHEKEDACWPGFYGPWCNLTCSSPRCGKNKPCNPENGLCLDPLEEQNQGAMPAKPGVVVGTLGPTTEAVFEEAEQSTTKAPIIVEEACLNWTYAACIIIFFTLAGTGNYLFLRSRDNGQKDEEMNQAVGEGTEIPE